MGRKTMHPLNRPSLISYIAFDRGDSCNLRRKLTGHFIRYHPPSRNAGNVDSVRIHLIGGFEMVNDPGEKGQIVSSLMTATPIRIPSITLCDRFWIHHNPV